MSSFPYSPRKSHRLVPWTSSLLGLRDDGCRRDGSRRSTNNRRGVQTLELIVVLPILLLALLAIFQFGTAMVIHHAVINVAEETARELSKVFELDITDPDDIDEVGEVVNEIMGVHGIALGDDGLLVVVEDSTGVVCLGDPAMEPEFCPPGTSITEEVEIKVTIFLLVENTPIPQLLDYYCIDFSDKYYEFCSIKRKECFEEPDP